MYQETLRFRVGGIFYPKINIALRRFNEDIRVRSTNVTGLSLAIRSPEDIIQNYNSKRDSSHIFTSSRGTTRLRRKIRNRLYIWTTYENAKTEKSRA